MLRMTSREGWAQADAAPLSEDDRAFGIRATIHYTDGTTKETTVSFNTDVDEWQYASMPIVANKAYNKLTIQLEYDKNVNTAIFDGIQLYKEEFGTRGRFCCPLTTKPKY